MSVPKDVQAFGAEVRRCRESLGWALPKLAKRSGLTPNYIGSVEMGNRDPSLSTLKKIAKGFGVPLSALLGAGGLSPAASEYVRLLERALPEVQEAVKGILTFSAGTPRR